MSLNTASYNTMSLKDWTPEQVEQWCGALLSGEYPKAGGTLSDDSGSCCIGVLGHETGRLIKNKQGRSGWDWYWNSGLPAGVQAPLSDHEMGTLAVLNDDEKTKTFRPVVTRILKMYTEARAEDKA